MSHRKWGRRAYPQGNWKPTGPKFTTTSEIDDPVTVRRLASGDLSCLAAGAAVRIAALDLVDQPGVSARSAAERLGCSVRTVQRRRAQRREWLESVQELLSQGKS
ncbi:MAG TPA: helix-turn-helix domain-containing protein [Geobacteraceae bacterium]|nr:helix-turn-helix domain-containing protein [Geobacteraceae bacterium]